MTRLSVNINKVATLRNARGEGIPDVIKFALECERFGAQGITVHPRPDERHITKNDVLGLKAKITTEYNIEGYPSSDFMNLVLKVEPTQVTLVPDSPDAITSNAGWDVKTHFSFLSEIIGRLHEKAIRVSIFTDTEEDTIVKAAETGADRVELYTKPYADLFYYNPAEAVRPYVKAANIAKGCGLGINAGHDLNLANLSYFSEAIPFLNEVSIGHALISDALYLGIEKTIHEYLKCLQPKII